MYSKSTSVDNSPREVTQTGISPWIRKQLGNLIRKKKRKKKNKKQPGEKGMCASYVLFSSLLFGLRRNCISIIYISFSGGCVLSPFSSVFSLCNVTLLMFFFKKEKEVELMRSA